MRRDVIKGEPHVSSLRRLDNQTPRIASQPGQQRVLWRCVHAFVDGREGTAVFARRGAYACEDTESATGGGNYLLCLDVFQKALAVCVLPESASHRRTGLHLIYALLPADSFRRQTHLLRTWLVWRKRYRCNGRVVGCFWVKLIFTYAYIFTSGGIHKRCIYLTTLEYDTCMFTSLYTGVRTCEYSNALEYLHGRHRRHLYLGQGWPIIIFIIIFMCTCTWCSVQ